MKTILVADDSPFIRLRLKNILSKLQPVSNVLEAEDGESTMSAFKKAKPDLVLLDIVMPGGQTEGVRVLKEILEFAPEARVVMITAVGFDSMIEECKKIGARGYITKPFDEKDILDEVRKYL